MESRKLNIYDIPSPCFVIETEKLRQNLALLKQIKKACGLKILFAQKAFASYAVYPMIAQALDGVCASGLWEARLANETFNGELHTYSPAYRENEIDEIFNISHTVVFNSTSQLNIFKNKIQQYRPTTQVGLRINPECSVATTALYDPCAAQSRLGVTLAETSNIDMAIVDGFHFHALCEQDSFALEKVLLAFESKFKDKFQHIQWLNMGGGHFITQPGYDTDHFIRTIQSFQKRHPHLTLYIEPGGAVVLNAGVLVSTVLDVLDQRKPPIAIMDISCPCHTPDVLEMPYRPSIENEIPIEHAPYTYQLGGISCLAGDSFGTYGFAKPLSTGNRIVFQDMAQYSIVKTTMFNGVQHPAIAIYQSETNQFNIIREFSFHDFKQRL